MSQKPQSPSQDSATLSRRRMFAGAGGMGALAAVAAVLPMTKAEAPAAVVAEADSKEGGYQLTEHVKRYYQTARV
jgi:hypothetical protein